MTEQQATQPPAAERAYERCLCREALDRVREAADHLKDAVLPRSDAAREHLRNSRIEFLKAIRSLIDDRITRLSAAGQPQGTKVTVE
jgi:hypothetical protein